MTRNEVNQAAELFSDISHGIEIYTTSKGSFAIRVIWRGFRETNHYTLEEAGRMASIVSAA